MSAPRIYPLTERFQQMLQDITVDAAVFTTYTFDPGFFEHHVVAQLFDIAYHHEPRVRIAQLDDYLRTSGDVKIDVFYDPHALTEGSDMSAKLDVGRYPVVCRGGVFHPKVFVISGKRIVEGDEETQVILVGTSSANLTRAGWWENIEFVHIEEFEATATAHLAYDVANFLRALRKKMPAGLKAQAVEKILKFLPKGEPYASMPQKSEGRLKTRLLFGQGGWHEALAKVLKSEVKGLSLEIISPYAQQSTSSLVLEPLIKRYSPEEVRVFLPTDSQGAITISEEVRTEIGKVEAVTYGTTCTQICGHHKEVDAPTRFVHAKVYRFVSENRHKREILIGGSLNLTAAAWTGRNFEAVVVLENPVEGQVLRWITNGKHLPKHYADVHENAGDSSKLGGAYPSITFDHATTQATLRWLGGKGPKEFGIRGADRVILPRAEHSTTVDGVCELSIDAARSLCDQLLTRSIVTVFDSHDSEYPVLVDELNMYLKPPIVKALTVSEVLEFWATLSQERRAQLIQTAVLRNELLNGSSEFDVAMAVEHYASMFDRIAGVLEGYKSLEKNIFEALENSRHGRARHVLFSSSSQSLLSLMDTISMENAAKENERDVRLEYLIAISAKNLVMKLDRLRVTSKKKNLEGFLQQHDRDWKILSTHVDSAFASARHRILASSDEADIAEFIGWFEKSYLSSDESLDNGVVHK